MLEAPVTAHGLATRRRGNPFVAGGAVSWTVTTAGVLVPDSVAIVTSPHEPPLSAAMEPPPYKAAEFRARMQSVTTASPRRTIRDEDPRRPP